MSQKLGHRGLRIDAKTGIISEVFINDYTDIAKHIGCSLFTTVRLSETETLYVDDEGLINNTRFAFRINYGEGYLMGNGLVLGNTLSGDTASSEMSAQELIDRIGIKYVMNIDTTESKPTRPAANLN